MMNQASYSIFELKTHTQQVENGRFSVELHSQAVSIHLPFFHFVWNRPTAVIDQHGQRHPITDPTRRAVWQLIALGLIVTTILKKRKTVNNQQSTEN